jgi:hypothetical protein
MLKGSNGIYLNSKSKPKTKSLEEKCGILNIWDVLGRRWSLLILKNLSSKNVGVLMFTATEPVEVGFGHRLPVDNATLSRLEANETVADFFSSYHVQNQEQTDTPGLLSVPSVIVPDYGTQSPYFSASIPFAADSIWLRTADGEPFIVVYEIVAEIHQPEAVLVDIK